MEEIIKKKRFLFASKPLITRIIIMTILTILSIAFFGVILFLSAWTINWLKAWLFLIVFGSISLITALIGVIKNPQMIDNRLKKHPKNKKWDTIVVSILGLNTFILFVAAGLDKRFSLLIQIPNLVSYIALPMTSIYIIIQLWAGLTNKYFSSHVRIEEEQKVIQTGPYKIVRHLFYSTFILFWIFTPLSLGSYLSVIPGLFGIILVVYRTFKEDKFLQENLPGYKEYSNNVKYRLFPGIW